jgi:hypothetical protein
VKSKTLYTCCEQVGRREKDYEKKRKEKKRKEEKRKEEKRREEKKREEKKRSGTVHEESAAIYRNC